MILLIEMMRDENIKVIILLQLIFLMLDSYNIAIAIEGDVTGPAVLAILIPM